MERIRIVRKQLIHGHWEKVDRTIPDQYKQQAIAEAYDILSFEEWQEMIADYCAKKGKKKNVAWES